MASRGDQQDLLEVLEISIAQSLPAVPSFLEQSRRHASSERTLRLAWPSATPPTKRSSTEYAARESSNSRAGRS